LDWKEYEREIEAQFRSEYPSAQIRADIKMPGKLSGIERQIDLLIQELVCDFSVTIVIDAKYHSRKIDVKDVEEFLGLVRDVGAHKGVMIASEGYTPAAIQRAYSDDVDVILEVLNFKDLPLLSGHDALPYSGSNGVALPAPFGWTIDGTQGRGALAYLYEQGLTFDEATKAHEFMYVNFRTKSDDSICDLAALLRHQETYMRESSNPVSSISFVDGVQRRDNIRTTIREARFKNYPCMAEWTGFVDFNDFIFMCVLFSPDELAAKNLRKLRFLLRKVLPMRVQHSGASTVPQK
jgi:Restriction endonuclease